MPRCLLGFYYFLFFFLRELELIQAFFLSSTHAFFYLLKWSFAFFFIIKSVFKDRLLFSIILKFQKFLFYILFIYSIQFFKKEKLAKLFYSVIITQAAKFVFYQTLNLFSFVFALFFQLSDTFNKFWLQLLHNFHDYTFN